jgi:hypothetical protein
MSLGTARIKVLVAMVALLLNTIFVPAAWAQSGKGIVTGRVTDTSDSILQAAQVVLQPKGGSAVSDAQGQFFVNDLEPGTYTVTITYVGFTAFTKTVTVVAGQSVTGGRQADACVAERGGTRYSGSRRRGGGGN